MSDEEHPANSSVLSAQPVLRDDLVSTAVKFLQNPRVAQRPTSEKETFLQKKGLTQAEIKAAFEALGTQNSNEGKLEHYSSVKVAQVHGYSHSLQPHPRSKWDIVKDILNGFILLSGTVYSLHYLYKKFIAPFLFGHEEVKTVTDTIQEMNNNLTRLVGDVSTAVQNLSETVATLRSKQYEQSEIKDLKAEVASLKALLLGRRQFPAPPSIVTGTPSIPTWQLGPSADQKLDLRCDPPNKHGHTDTVSLSSSPEIISVEDMQTNTVSLVNSGLNSNLPPRDPSESSESNSAEIVEMGASASGGSGDDTD